MTNILKLLKEKTGFSYGKLGSIIDKHQNQVANGIVKGYELELTSIEAIMREAGISVFKYEESGAEVIIQLKN